MSHPTTGRQVFGTPVAQRLPSAPKTYALCDGVASADFSDLERRVLAAMSASDASQIVGRWRAAHPSLADFWRP